MELPFLAFFSHTSLSQLGISPKLFWVIFRLLIFNAPLWRGDNSLDHSDQFVQHFVNKVSRA